MLRLSAQAAPPRRHATRHMHMLYYKMLERCDSRRRGRGRRPSSPAESRRPAPPSPGPPMPPRICSSICRHRLEAKRLGADPLDLAQRLALLGRTPRGRPPRGTRARARRGRCTPTCAGTSGSRSRSRRQTPARRAPPRSTARSRTSAAEEPATRPRCFVHQPVAPSTSLRLDARLHLASPMSSTVASGARRRKRWKCASIWNCSPAPRPLSPASVNVSAPLVNAAAASTRSASASSVSGTCVASTRRRAPPRAPSVSSARRKSASRLALLAVATTARCLARRHERRDEQG